MSSGETRKVDHLSTVRLGAARYSVPHRLRGEQVQVLVDGDEVRVLHRGGEVALHRLQPPGGASIADEHYPSGARGTRPLRPRHPAEVRFLELGEVAERYLRAAAAAGTPRLRLQLERVLELERSHGRELVQSCARAGGGVRPLRTRGRGRHPPRRRRRATDEPGAEPTAGPGRASRGSNPPDAELPVAGMSVEPLDPVLVQGLRRLKLRRLRQVAPEVCQTARTQRWRPEELLRVLVEEECQARDESNRCMRLKQAAFPVHKTLDAFDLSVSSLSRATFDYLASLEWLPQHRNLALVGPPGTGKSHLAVALGHAAVDAGYRVRFFRADSRRRTALPRSRRQQCRSRHRRPPARRPGDRR